MNLDRDELIILTLFLAVFGITFFYAVKENL
jgi:hypothetical protein